MQKQKVNTVLDEKKLETKKKKFIQFWTNQFIEYFARDLEERYKKWPVEEDKKKELNINHLSKIEENFSRKEAGQLAYDKLKNDENFEDFIEKLVPEDYENFETEDTKIWVENISLHLGNQFIFKYYKERFVAITLSQIRQVKEEKNISDNSGDDADLIGLFNSCEEEIENFAKEKEMNIRKIEKAEMKADQIIYFIRTNISSFQEKLFSQVEEIEEITKTILEINLDEFARQIKEKIEDKQKLKNIEKETAKWKQKAKSFKKLFEVKNTLIAKERSSKKDLPTLRKELREKAFLPITTNYPQILLIGRKIELIKEYWQETDKEIKNQLEEDDGCFETKIIYATDLELTEIEEKYDGIKENLVEEVQVQNQDKKILRKEEEKPHKEEKEFPWKVALPVFLLLVSAGGLGFKFLLKKREKKKKWQKTHSHKKRAARDFNLNN